MTLPSPFVDTHWLAEHLSDPSVCVVDASWYLPSAGRDGAAEFQQVHIPGAVYFDLDRVAAGATDLPHMIATPEVFSRAVGDLGIRDTNTVVVYDSAGLLSAARVWWNFRIMGAQNCFVLRGGLPKWLAEGRPVSSGPCLPTPRPFSPKFAADMVVDKLEILRQIERGDEPDFQVVDVRPNLRFAGLEAEPRPGLRSGSMPGSINLPFSDLIENGQLIAPPAFISRAQTAGIDLKKPIVASCGSGVTAPILCLALAQSGIECMRVYDGSWAEWGRTGNGLPVVGADGSLI